MNAGFQVRDRRRKGYFVVDDLYLNGYAKVLGPIGTAIYLSLCRHVDRNESCFPSEQRIAEQHGISARSVRKYLHLLERLRLIAVERRRAESGGFLNNVYHLLDKSEWLPPAELDSGASGTTFRHQRKTSAEPAENDSRNQRNHLPLKGTHVKGTQEKGLVARPKAPATGEVDTRHPEVRNAIQQGWRERNPGVPTAPWGPTEGRNLALFLRENPSWTTEQILVCLQHRFASEANHSEPPHFWLRNLAKYAGGPLDRFGKPLKGTLSYEQQKIIRTATALERAIPGGTQTLAVPVQRLLEPGDY